MIALPQPWQSNITVATKSVLIEKGSSTRKTVKNSQWVPRAHKNHECPKASGNQGSVLKGDHKPGLNPPIPLIPLTNQGQYGEEGIPHYWYVHG